MVEPLFIREFSNGVNVGETVELLGAEAKHAISVRRMRVGEAIQLSDGRGLRVRGVIKALHQQALEVFVDEVSSEALRQPSLTLIQALAKGDRDELAVQAGTELGIHFVIPWQADRSISRWEGPKIAKGVERWQSIANEAAKQALRALHPLVGQPQTTKQLAESISEFSLFLVLDPTASKGLGSIELPTSGKLAIAVGPEGGISENELHQLESAGAVRVHLGASILRTSTAGLAAISAIQSKLGLWG